MMRYRMAASGTAHMVDPEGRGVLCANRAAAGWPEVEADEPPGPLCRTCTEAQVDRQIAVWTEDLKARVTQDLPQWRTLCRLIARQRERQVKPRDLPPDLRAWLGPPWGSRGDLGTAIPPQPVLAASPAEAGRWRRVALVHVIGLVFYWNEGAAWRLRPDWKKRLSQIEAGQWPAGSRSRKAPRPSPKRNPSARGAQEGRAPLRPGRRKGGGEVPRGNEGSQVRLRLRRGTRRRPRRVSLDGRLVLSSPNFQQQRTRRKESQTVPRARNASC